MTRFASCLCGATRYRWSGPVDEVVLCHCGQCRRANGGAFNVAVLADVADVRFDARDMVREYESSPGKYRAFCAGCGAPRELVVSHRAEGWDWIA